MTRFRLWGLTLAVLALTLTPPTASAHCGPYQSTSQAAAKPQGAAAGGSGLTCTIYALKDFGDAEIGKWLAETIPQMIEPATWKASGPSWGASQTLGSPSSSLGAGPVPPVLAPASARGVPQGTLSYYAPGQILVVNHTPAVHAKVNEFLHSVKKALPTVKAAHAHTNKVRPTDPLVMPARHEVPAPMPAAETVVPQTSSYPVPTQARPPKHLFHFIIRYEGEGLVDANVVKMIKAQSAAQQKEATTTNVLEAIANALSCLGGVQGYPSVVVGTPPAVVPPCTPGCVSMPAASGFAPAYCQPPTMPAAGSGPGPAPSPEQVLPAPRRDATSY